MSVRVTVNSLPIETRQKFARQAEMLHSVRSPIGAIQESRMRASTGLPVCAGSTSGGQSQFVTIDTLRMPYSLPTSAGPSMGPCLGAMDAWDKNRMIENMWRTHFLETVSGRNQILERAPVGEIGPMAGLHAGADRTAIGVDWNFPHRPEYPRTGTRYTARPSYARHETIMPSVDDPEEGEEDSGVRIRSEDEEEFRAYRHSGLTCEQAHGVMPHYAWTSKFPR